MTKVEAVTMEPPNAQSFSLTTTTNNNNIRILQAEHLIIKPDHQNQIKPKQSRIWAQAMS